MNSGTSCTSRVVFGESVILDLNSNSAIFGTHSPYLSPVCNPTTGGRVMRHAARSDVIFQDQNQGTSSRKDRKDQRSPRT